MICADAERLRLVQSSFSRCAWRLGFQTQLACLEFGGLLYLEHGVHGYQSLGVAQRAMLPPMPRPVPAPPGRRRKHGEGDKRREEQQKPQAPGGTTHMNRQRNQQTGGTFFCGEKQDDNFFLLYTCMCTCTYMYVNLWHELINLVNFNNLGIPKSYSCCKAYCCTNIYCCTFPYYLTPVWVHHTTTLIL